MIPQKIYSLFDFIDFLDTNKNEYIKKYIPLCNELEKLDEQRKLLKPRQNYKDKKSYDIIQEEIKEKFKTITENIYNPITNRLKDLGIWSGDGVFTSIWNNNIEEINNFKSNFTEEDAKQVFHYKQKYLSFRNDTNSNFLCLSFVFSNLDEILKVLFDFFKDSDDNEFDSFEAKTIKVESLTELAKNLKENNSKNVKYSIPSDSVFPKAATKSKTFDIKNELNFFNMGDNYEIGNIVNNDGQVTVGKDNKIEIGGNDEIAKKSYRWQKRDTIIMAILAIAGLIIAYLSFVK